MVGRAGTPTIQYSVNTQRMMTPWTWQQSITYYMCPPQEITKIGLFCLACAGTGHTTGECAMKAVSVNPSLPWPHMKHRQSTQPLLPASIRTEVAARGKISPCMCYQFRQPQTHSVLRNHKPIVCSMLFFQKGTSATSCKHTPWFRSHAANWLSKSPIMSSTTPFIRYNILPSSCPPMQFPYQPIPPCIHL